MRDSDITILIALILATGAVAILLLVGRPSVLGSSNSRRRLRYALTVSAGMLVAGGVATVWITNALESLRIELVNLDHELTNEHHEMRAERASLSAAVSVLESVTSERRGRAKAYPLTPHQRIDDLTRIVLPEFAREIARVQQALSDSQPSASFESVLPGSYIVGIETSVFTPDGEDEDWWAGISELTRGYSKLDAAEGMRIRVCLRGIVTMRGHYGHMGGFPRLFLVTEVLAAGDEATAACSGPSRPVSIHLPTHVAPALGTERALGR